MRLTQSQALGPVVHVEQAVMDDDRGVKDVIGLPGGGRVGQQQRVGWMPMQDHINSISKLESPAGLRRL
jgi:hypothetical protein